MSLPVVEWLAFWAFSLIAVAGALGMTTTMSMFRSGVFLMASFAGVAGLFLLLSADLLALLQIMMYVGGMMVMILFMVLFMPDPGGAMMAAMDMNRVERLFTRGIVPQHDMSGMDMDMGMTTPIRRMAAVLAAATAALLLVLLALRSPWPVSPVAPDPRSAQNIGHLLMGKYMIAFEGAGLLILIGIFGAVLLARPAQHPDKGSREERVAVAEPPAPPA
jgi:NADH-quinone oxidoreductase subunit J